MIGGVAGGTESLRIEFGSWPVSKRSSDRNPGQRARPVLAGSQTTNYVIPPPEQLVPEAIALRDRVRQLEDRLRAVEAVLEPAEVELREVPRDQAKRELLNYFKENPGQYPSDAAVALNLDAPLVRDLCLELVSEGRLEG